MTTFLNERLRPETQTAGTAVLAIDRLPRRLRSTIETAMVECIPSDSELCVPGADPLTASWCTQWTRSSNKPSTWSCRQVITGTSTELELFDATLSHLAMQHDFVARLTIVD